MIVFLKEWLKFGGRINRLKYIIYNLIILIFLPILFYMMDNEIQLVKNIGFYFFTFLYILSFYLWFSLTFRRLRDLNKNGFFFLLFFIPFINILFLIYLLFFKGTKGKNEYGEDPLIY